MALAATIQDCIFMFELQMVRGSPTSSVGNCTITICELSWPYI